MKLSRLLRHAGNPAGLPGLIWKNLIYPFSAQAAERRYDLRLGIDTAGWIGPCDMDIGRDEVQRSEGYGATPPATARFLIAQVADRAKGFTFVDVGSGKGRVLMIASQFPFRRVVGLEHSAALNQIAAKNVHRFAAQHPDVAPVELLTGDATKLPLPDGPLVVFLFNPFGPEAVRDFASSLKASYTAAPRKIICIYYNPTHAEILAGLGIFTRQEQVVCPADPIDRFQRLNLPAVVFET
jgi:SAM-dependent methyltransferase